MTSANSLKQVARDAVLAAADDLVQLSRQIYERPELAFEEHAAAQAVRDVCRSYGLRGDTGTGGIATAVKMTSGDGLLNIAYCAEYDALPEMGHACGHNLIAASSVGASIGLAAVSDEIGARVTLLGTPAEERGAGKAALLAAGAFDDVHAALMAHPVPAPFDVSCPRTTAVAQLELRYEGRAAHAAVAPELGINAADALTVAQVGVGLLRQHLAPRQQVHGIATFAGSAANVISSESRAEYYVRCDHVDEIGSLRDRVVACFAAGAMATGCRHEVRDIGAAYAELRCDGELSDLYAANAEQCGRTLRVLDIPPTGSTDMGNVSHLLPAIHPYFGLDCLPALPHQPEFAEHVATDRAHRSMIEVAVALASTAIDAAVDARVRNRLLAPSSAGSG